VPGQRCGSVVVFVLWKSVENGGEMLENDGTNNHWKTGEDMMKTDGKIVKTS